MSGHDAMRECLIDLDVQRATAVWAAVAPGLPAPRNGDEALVALHMARTAARCVPFRLRAWSHRWLAERGLPSRLPDAMRPNAERMYPRIVDAVGIAVKSRFAEVVTAVRGAMEHAVNDCYANGDREPGIVRPRMLDARARELRGLGLTRREN